MKSRINKKSSSVNVGIEHLSFHYKADIEESLPERFSIAPSGDFIPSHLDNLYELSPGDNTLKQLIQPKITDVSLLRPRDYQTLFNTTAEDLSKLGSELKTQDFEKAARAMKKIIIDQKYLATAFYLLLQV